MTDSETPSLFGDDDTDEDPTYTVDDDADHSHSSDSQNNKDDQDGPPTKRAKHPGRKKTRRAHLWKRNIARKNRNEGKAYVDRKGKPHGEKKVRECIHQCRFKCNDKIDEQQRREVFRQYWELGNWELQTSFLSSCLSVEQPARKKKEGKGSKSLSCQFHLLGKRVCKKFFISTLDVSNKRVTNVIANKNNSTTGVSPRENRGRRLPGNTLSNEKVEIAKQHIRSVPRYSSHYSRNQAPNRKYLSSNLNVSKMYALYTEFCQERQVEPVKESYYRYLFNTNFNLSFHKPHTDTCVTCDRLQNFIDNGLLNEKNEAQTQKELHLRRAESARKQIQEAQKEVKNDASHVAVCFDLQKMLPTPVLTCKKVYYSRQLWTYNFCVHNLGTGNAFMYMWHEGQAARGCEEILSCLLKYINTLPTTVKKITVFSDNAGGQNKSRFTVKFWLYIVSNTHIEQVDHKYLLSGHSYNDCDKNFGVIERVRKQSDRGIFVPQDWMDVVAKSSRRFLVTSMQNEEFISLASLEEYYVQTVKGIRNMTWLRFKKSDPFSLFYKATFNPDMEFSVYNMKPKPMRGGRPRALVPKLSSKGDTPGIKASKYKDLQELLQFVPPCHHPFYKALLVRPTGQQRRRREAEPNDDDYSKFVEEEDDNILDSDSD